MVSRAGIIWRDYYRLDPGRYPDRICRRRPFRSYQHIAKASFGDIGVLSDTIVKATPIILAALACSVAFRMKLWNIGAEGQFIMGAFGASAIVLAPVLPAETSRWIFIPVMMMAGMAAGAIWGFIPGYLKAKFNVNEIISTLMLNYVAWRGSTFGSLEYGPKVVSKCRPSFPTTASLPRLLEYAKTFPIFRGLDHSSGFAHWDRGRDHCLVHHLSQPLGI